MLFRSAPLINKLAITASSLQSLGLAKATAEVQAILQSPGKRAGIAVSLARSMLFRLKSQGGKQTEARDVLETYIQEFGEDIVLLNLTTNADHFLPAFTDLFAEGKYLEFMERAFSLGGAKAIPLLRQLEKVDIPEVRVKALELVQRFMRGSIEPLTIKMLGAFEISQGGRTLTTGDWKSKKALTALKYLTANRDKGYLPRDVLMELLWPETPLESAQKSLNAALTSVRKTLEPDASRGESSYLISKGDALCLELGPGGSSDLELFREKLYLAAKAREVGDFDLYFRALKETAELYRGDF